MRRKNVLKYLDNVDEKDAQADITKSIQKLQSYITHLSNFRFNLLLYKILKNRSMPATDLAKLAGLSPQRMYQLLHWFEDKELERQMELELGVVPETTEKEVKNNGQEN